VKGAPKAGALWRFNLARNDRINHQYNTWAELRRGFHEPESFGVLQFVAVSVGVGPRRLHRRGRDLIVAIGARGGATKPVTVKATGIVRTPGGHFEFGPSHTLSPGESAELTAVGKGGWVARTSAWISYTVEADGQRVYSAPTLTIPSGQILPARPKQPVPVVIQNAQTALTFDKSTGRLLRIANKTSGMAIACGPVGTPIMELDAVRFIKNPRFFRKEDVQTLVPDYETLVSVTRRDGPDGQSVVIKHLVASYIGVTLTVTVPKQGVETQWRIELDNRLTYRPTQSLVVHRVRYPLLVDVPESACGDEPYVITPMLMGQKIPEPGKNLVSERPLSYLGRATMGWFDFYGSKGGLYFKVGDVDPLPQTDLIMRSDRKTHALRLGIQRWALCWPGQKWTPGPCSVGAHTGDWHTAADMYRSWCRKTLKQMAVPKWLADQDAYVMSGGPNYEFSDFPRVIENAKAMGVSYVELWSEMTGGDISYHAYALPNPYMGSEAELKKGIADLHARGGHIGVYLNFNTGDPLLGTFVRQPPNAQKIPKGLPRPALDYMKDNWVQQSLMSPAGGYSTWNTIVPGYLDGYWNACPAGDKWTEYYAYWVARWANEYKLDVWYLDSCPVSRGSPCFAFDHGHRDPAPEGQSIINFYKRMRQRVPKDFCIMQEYSSDRLLPYSTHALGLMWHPRFAHPEVVRYTLPEYILFSGMCNGTKGLKQFYPGEKLTHQDAIERVFLIGNRYEFPLSNRPPELANQWAAKMVRLRHACHAEMNYGDFLDEIGLEVVGAPERVHARLFRRADRGRLAITLLDRRNSKKTPLKLAVDLSKVGVGAAKGVKLVTLDGEQALPPLERGGVKVVVTVPPYKGRPAAILIETEKGQ
jgi:uncharacterized protein DUF6259